MFTSQIRDKNTCKIYVARGRGKFPTSYSGGDNCGNSRIDRLNLIKNQEELFHLSETANNKANYHHDHNDVTLNFHNKRMEIHSLL